jgi:hypothetical protein
VGAPKTNYRSLNPGFFETLSDTSNFFKSSRSLKKEVNYNYGKKTCRQGKYGLLLSETSDGDDACRGRAKGATASTGETESERDERR